GNYTGERFYDYKSILQAYTLFDTSLGYKLDIYGVNAELSFKINNITNKEYQVVAWYAMPPRNYLVSLSINI
ncbi:MAG: TonB-dependent receptor, partial [Bacteroidota bacterium]